MSLLERLQKEKNIDVTDNKSIKSKKPQNEKEDPFAEVKAKIHSKIIEQIKTEAFKNMEPDEDDEGLKNEITAIAEEILEQETSYFSKNDRQKIISEVIDETIGFGPINPLIHDSSVSEIMVNGPDQVYVEKKGRLTLSDVTFKDEQHVMHVIEKIVAPLGRRIDESSPMVDARLPNGSRVNVIIPPLALNGPTITIRKFSEKPYTVKDLINFGTITPNIAMFLKACVESRLNIVVSGGTGSGKTTTLNVISSFIPDDERIVTIEDAAEIQLRQEHVVRLETRPPNIEGKGAITIRDLVRNSLRMRPDRIVVGEVRSGEALDMLQAMNTGHDGSLTTGHANTPRDMVARLETMVLMAGMELPVRAIREQIASAVDLIVQQSRLKDGSRKITHITEVVGMEGDIITLQDIFVYKQKGKDENGKMIGDVVPTGIKPKFFDKFDKAGVILPQDLFSHD
ncbi:CpaF family protein [Pseudobacteroides cellulosolvens]|uniref:Type II secretion system protein E n=1 Tax=Pseudobacteroides cellulosolvens ATCC 35603 = DSM 2933 TaxID=398512 RepID=A0A0L6JHY8_9FIRM|nr:CpaF family protein [Pseudobacteroides cellulosolvens]KNY25097.1 type II secretion system protein E [Pseudobacteroides cellulosolvens ATCC 35603 = DSM 2933]